MNIGKTLFAQMMDFLPWKSFHRIVARYSDDYRVRTLPEAGAFYVMDRGYLDFERLHGPDQAGAFFVVRAKSNLDARGLYSAPIERSTGLICDQTIVLNGLYSSQHYPQHLRRIRYARGSHPSFSITGADRLRAPPCSWPLSGRGSISMYRGIRCYKSFH
jgi:Domain of unknown function (DUF4372)